MWIENKTGDGIVGPARIGLAIPSKSGQSLDYAGKTFQTLAGRGFKANYFDVDTGGHYWISGCRKDGMDALYTTTVEIDDNIREEYWAVIRNQQANKNVRSFKAQGKH